MHLVVIGLNHKTAPVELRERLSIGEAQLADALSGLKSHDPISECLVLSTCNRIEIYAYITTREDDDLIVDFLAKFCKTNQDGFRPHLYSYAGHKAVEHLFRVASGIDSMVLGEDQILGQVKSAYGASSKAGATGSVLNTLFQQAITIGKKARTDTNIGRGAFSVGSVAVQLARSIFDEPKGRTILIIGAGKMGKLTITHLTAWGASTVLVANRTHKKAVDLAAQCCGQAIKFDDLPSALQTADIVITSTGAKEPIITREMVSSAMRVRRGRPAFFIDIAVPRDIEPSVGDIDNVFVYNIDDLQAAVDTDTAGRQFEVAKVEAIVKQGVEEFMGWFRTLDAVPVITALRDKFEDIRQGEIEKLRAKLPDLPPEDIEAINAATRSIVNRICHQPMIRIKEYASDEDASEKLRTVCDIFGVDPEDSGE